MSKETINVDRIRGASGTLTRGDIDMLSDAIECCGTATDFRDQLRRMLGQAYDADRKSRLIALTRVLNERELHFLCDNFAELSTRKTGSRRSVAG